MRCFALFLMVLSLGMFALGCGGEDKKKKEKDGKTPVTVEDKGGKTDEGGKTDLGGKTDEGGKTDPVPEPPTP